MFQTLIELKTIHLRRLALPGKKYYGDNEKVYIGSSDKRLKLLDRALNIPLKPFDEISDVNVQEGIESLSNKTIISINNLQDQINNINLKANIYKFTAGETLGGQRLVMLINNKAHYFDPTDDNNIGKELGITNQSAIINSLVDVVIGGVITDIGWGLTPNFIYYAGVNGTITTVLPTAPFIFQRIGVAIDSNSLKLEFSEPISII